MKRLCRVLLVAILFVGVLFVTGCDKKENNNQTTTKADSIVGTYKLVEMSEGDYTIDADMLEQMGENASIIVNEDKTFKMTALDEDDDETVGTYDDKEFTANGEGIAYEYADGTLTLKEDDMKMIFKKNN